MPGEIAYAASKGALASITRTLADQLARPGDHAERGQPGPSRYWRATRRRYSQALRSRFPHGRWGTPDDPARLDPPALTRDEAAWITGRVINTEGGFRRTADIHTT